jgi:hypothetical protein
MGRGIRITIRAKGAKDAASFIRRIWTNMPVIGRSTIFGALTRVMQKLRIYPAQRPGQRYVRTFKFRGGWNIKKVKPVGYQLANATTYSKYVVGNAYGLNQAWMHKDRWTTFRDRLDAEIAQLPETLARNFVMVARRKAKV